ADGSLPTRATPYLTEEGVVLGTPGYLAPEQVQSGVADPASDVFAVGALLYDLLAGRPAFPGRTPTERVRALTDGRPLAPLREAVPSALAAVVAKALARDPAARHLTAGAFLRE